MLWYINTFRTTICITKWLFLFSTEIYREKVMFSLCMIVENIKLICSVHLSCLNILKRKQIHINEDITSENHSVLLLLLLLWCYVHIFLCIDKKSKCNQIKKITHRNRLDCSHYLNDIIFAFQIKLFFRILLEQDQMFSFTSHSFK